MRIVFLNLASAHDFGGGEKWTMETAEGLAERGHFVILAGRKGTSFASRSISDKLIFKPVTAGIDYSPATINSIMRLFRINRPDVIVVHHNKDVRTGGIAAKMAGIPVVHRNGFPIIHDNWRHKLTYKFIDRILTNSNQIKEKYLSFGWIDENRIDVIPNGISEFNISVQRESIRSKWDFKNDDLVAIFAGRLTRIKRVSDLIEAFRKLDKSSQWHLVILGKGEEYQTLLEMVINYGLEQRVKLIGYQEHAARLLPAGDIVILPSEEEGMPNVLLEAMVQGIPVGATPVGDVPYLVDYGKAGWLVKTGDIVGWVDLLLQLEQNPARLAEMARTGQQHVRNNFTFEKMIDGVETSLRKAV
ncbi:glycosyltransferase family 4 protein [Calditrichota bacterium]